METQKEPAQAQTAQEARKQAFNALWLKVILAGERAAGA